MHKEFFDTLNLLCEAYHRDTFDKSTDAPAFSLLLSLMGLAPLGVIPIRSQDSLNCFRRLSHQERYSFVMTEISKLLESPSSNRALRDIFARLSPLVEPVTDAMGSAVFDGGKISFGSYENSNLAPLIFSEV